MLTSRTYLGIKVHTEHFASSKNILGLLLLLLLFFFLGGGGGGGGEISKYFRVCLVDILSDPIRFARLATLLTLQ